METNLPQSTDHYSNIHHSSLATTFRGSIAAPSSINKIVVPLITLRPVYLLLHSPAEPLAVSKNLLPLNVFSAKRRKLSLNGRANFPSGIPVLTITKPECFGKIVQPVVQPSHAAFDLFQTLLSVAAAGERETEIKPNHVRVGVRRQRLL